MIALLLGLPVFGEHGGTQKFEEITSRYFSRSHVKVINQNVPFGWSADETKLLYRVADDQDKEQTYAYDLATGQEAPSADAIPALPKQERVRWWQPRAGYENQRSNDGKWEVILREGSVYLKDRKSNQETLLAEKSVQGDFRGNPYWSADSQKFVLWQTKEKPVRKVNYSRSSPKNQLQPEYFSVDYVKPGDEITISVPWVFYVDGSKPLEADRSLIPNPFEINQIGWRDDSERLTYQYVERGYGKFRVLEMNAKQRTQRILIDEQSDTFVYVSGYSFRYDLSGGQEILWASERDGWNHLYLLDGATGKVKKPLTKGKWVMKKVIEVNEEKRQVLVQICGCYPAQDPYFEHYAMVHIDSGKMVPLTSSAGQHERPVFSPKGNYYVCRWSRIDHPPVYELRRTVDGKLLKTLSEANDKELRSQWQLPEPFVSKDREGKFDIYGVIVKPPDFDPAKKYPVIEYIYAGPQDAFVRKSWTPWQVPMHEIAVHGFIVVQIDGRGTAHRGKEFHDQCYKNLKDAGFPDRIAWMKAAAQKIPQMDLTRVGIFGGSAGGQNALGAMLFHGDFYKAACADCGCHDNRMDKIWWNEQWMDWPLGPHYADNSNVTHAKNLQGALMLTVGEVDTNVDPASTMQVVNALIKADKDFEYIMVPNGQHGCGEARHMQRKRVDFFQRHLQP